VAKIKAINEAVEAQTKSIEIREGFFKGLTLMEKFVQKEYDSRLSLIESVEKRIERLSANLIELKESLGEVEEAMSGSETMKRQVTQLQFSFMDEKAS
jgi:hypothetical protein